MNERKKYIIFLITSLIFLIAIASITYILLNYTSTVDRLLENIELSNKRIKGTGIKVSFFFF